MAEYINVNEFLQKAKEGLPIVDVRSPGEYEHAHIIGAVNMPIFNNEERAEVGTIYKKIGKTHAVQKGLEFVGPKLKDFTKRALKLKSEEILIHCWRGGMRSASMAWLFETVGLKVYLLTGGYKAYRHYVLESFQTKFNFMLLGGSTGSGKTEMLELLKAKGEQVIDLEGIANHKGSAFGGIGQNEQPTNEHFENLLSYELLSLDTKKTIWLEDESRNVGRDFIPQGFWDEMRDSPVIRIDCDYEIRLERIMRDYACLDVENLKNSITKIRKRLGYDKCKMALDFCDNNDIEQAARICLDYYDKLYSSSLEKRFEGSKHKLLSLELHDLDTSEQIVKLIELNTKYKNEK